MTESEAWLNLAETFEADRPLPHYPKYLLVGICSQMGMLASQRAISIYMLKRMTARLDECFNPNGVDMNWNFFWAENDRRPTRDLRATACCFLAAMSP